MKKKHILIFNKISGEFFAKASENAKDSISTDFFKIKELEFDDDIYKWDDGTFSNGKLVLIKDEPTKVYESELDKLCKDSIEREVKLHHQLNIISNLLNQIVEEIGISGENVDKFKEIHDFIEKRRLMNNRYKKAYYNNKEWNYISKKDVELKEKNRMNGGISEYLQGISNSEVNKKDKRR